MALDAKGTPAGPLNLGVVPQKYVSLGDLIDPTKPDNRDLLVKTYGDQGITGFLELTGAKKNAGTSDEVQWWEEGRLHRIVTATCTVAGTVTITHVDGTAVADHAAVNASEVVRPNDVLLLADSGIRMIVDTPAGGTAFTFSAKNLSGGAAISVWSGSKQLNVIGNVYGQGSAQPSKFYQSDVTKRINPYIITKETFHVNGSQATNIGWINVNGDYRWYVKGEMDTRKRFLNQREAMLMYSQLVDSTANGTANSITIGSGTASNTIVGSEGYFAAIEDRGIVATSTHADFLNTSATAPSLDDIDAILLLLDKEGAPAEYAMYVDRNTSLAIDDMLATGISSSVTAGLPGQFGAFANSSDMAVQLGFKSFTRGGYTFHKHDWKLLNDPTMGGSYTNTATGQIKGVMCPMSTVADAKTGNKAPALEMNFKSANGYSRDMEHWVEGGGVLGFNTNDLDLAKFHYRSECNLVTRAANQHVLLKY